MYIVYGGFCVVGFVAWIRIERRERAEITADGVDSPVSETVG
jgi:nicotinamide mononucleotide transporter